ncbi:MAG: hypothetical protein JSS38_03770 [Nitrospira sp.]|nr:hypothetical protein [Nitrospira sp.]
MQHVIIIHEVDAYQAWKAIFDQAADMKKRAGEISYQLLRDDNDANKDCPLLGVVLAGQGSTILRLS